jgi:hypothetical protein
MIFSTSSRLISGISTGKFFGETIFAGKICNGSVLLANEKIVTKQKLIKLKNIKILFMDKE